MSSVIQYSDTGLYCNRRGFHFGSRDHPWEHLWSNRVHSTVIEGEGGASVLLNKNMEINGVNANIETSNALKIHARTFSLNCKDWNARIENNFEMCFKRAVFTGKSAQVKCHDQVALETLKGSIRLASGNGTSEAIAISAQKGGVSVASGPRGTRISSKGNISFDLEGKKSKIMFGQNSIFPSEIHLGNATSNVVVHNDLEVKGRLILNETAVVEKNLSVTRRVENIIECKTTLGDSLRDFGLIGKSNEDTFAGLVYDQREKNFYISSNLGPMNDGFRNSNRNGALVLGNLRAEERIAAPIVAANFVRTNNIRGSNLHIVSDGTLLLDANCVSADTIASNKMTCGELVVNEAKIHAMFENWVGQTCPNKSIAEAIERFRDKEKCIVYLNWDYDPKVDEFYEIIFCSSTTIIYANSQDVRGSWKIGEGCERVVIRGGCIGETLKIDSLPGAVVFDEMCEVSEDFSFQLSSPRI